MDRLAEIRGKISSEKEVLGSRFHVRRLGIFGSVARGDADEDSDLDILVDFSEPVGLFAFVRLEEYLERLTGMNIDLVPLDGIKKALREEILSSVVYL